MSSAKKFRVQDGVGRDGSGAQQLLNKMFKPIQRAWRKSLCERLRPDQVLGPSSLVVYICHPTRIIPFLMLLFLLLASSQRSCIDGGHSAPSPAPPIPPEHPQRKCGLKSDGRVSPTAIPSGLVQSEHGLVSNSENWSARREATQPPFRRVQIRRAHFRYALISALIRRANQGPDQGSTATEHGHALRQSGNAGRYRRGMWKTVSCIWPLYVPTLLLEG